MALQLQTPVFQINQLASKLAPQLKKLGIEIVEDLIFYYPFRHDDFSQVVAIKDLEPGKLATVKGKVELIKNQRSWKRRVLITESIISDQTGSVKAIWFGQPYVGRILKPGDEVFISGRVDQEKGIVFNSPSYEKITRTKKSLGTTHTARLVPIYNLTKGITSKQLRYLIRIVLTGLKPVTDYLPATIKKNLNFPSLEEAVQQIHFPDNQHQLEQAKKRLKFDEFFLIQLKNQLIRQELKKSRAEMIKFQEETVKRFVEQLPFKLTNAQRQAAWEILKDLARGYPMNRLLEGDVGSGKTVVAIIAMLNVVSVSQQAALMAPTEILARQHYQTVIQLLKGQGIKVGILTRSEIKLSGQGKITKKEILEKIKQGEVEIIIGTHALIQEKVEFNNLALAIIDEQHRFGVEQRRALQQESGNQQTVPHFLSMTATPIPRSLALTLYGDLDLSIIDQLPPGRKKVITKIVQPTEREQTYDFIKQEIAQGRQAFVICPLIDPSDKLGVRSVKEEAEKLNRQIFPELKIGVLHGRLKA